MGNTRSLTQTTTEENEANDALQLGSECLKGEKMVANETRSDSKTRSFRVFSNSTEYQFQNIAPDLAIVDNSVFQGGEQYALVEFIS
ncbi:hypothetical protein SO802_029224 [Lithocarpus litseifolius]|uniref:Uncharacterized protein n=1 Tax=Lithocarpus litseifolius TaxID=425828 RepID=A0AAW2BSH2_9ROSI